MASSEFGQRIGFKTAMEKASSTTARAKTPNRDKMHKVYRSSLPLIVQMGDPRIRTWLCVVEDMAVDVLLRTTLIALSIQGIFRKEWKFVPFQSRSVVILLATHRWQETAIILS